MNFSMTGQETGDRATFSNISAISWPPDLEEAGVPGENYRSLASNW
jgi:hypothetical protein